MTAQELIVEESRQPVFQTVGTEDDVPEETRETYVAGVIADLAPANAIEREIVDSIADLRWRRRELQRYERGLRGEPSEALARELKSVDMTVTNLERLPEAIEGLCAMIQEDLSDKRRRRPLLVLQNVTGVQHILNFVERVTATDAADEARTALERFIVADKTPTKKKLTDLLAAVEELRGLPDKYLPTWRQRRDALQARIDRQTRVPDPARIKLCARYAAMLNTRLSAEYEILGALRRLNLGARPGVRLVDMPPTSKAAAGAS